VCVLFLTDPSYHVLFIGFTFRMECFNGIWNAWASPAGVFASLYLSVCGFTEGM